MSDTLKLEAGKYYRTRDGYKALVSAERPAGVISSPQFVGWILEGPCAGRCFGWGADGFSQNSQDGMRQFGGDGRQVTDIVAEWKDPDSSTVTLHLHRWRDGHVTVDKYAYAPTWPGTMTTCPPKLLARKTVTITEGEGL